jgi:hypothetical protein
VPERTGVLVEHGLDAEHRGVPRLADREVAHRQGHVRDGGRNSRCSAHRVVAGQVVFDVVGGHVGLLIVKAPWTTPDDHP